MHRTRWDSKLLSKFHSMIASFGSTFFAVAFFLSAQQVSAIKEEVGSPAPSEHVVLDPKIKTWSFPALRYSAIDCRESLQREKRWYRNPEPSIELQLLNLAFSEGRQNRYENLYRLLSHYGVLTGHQFAYSVWTSLRNLGMGSLADKALNSYLIPEQPPQKLSKKELKEQLRIFEKLRDLAATDQTEKVSPEYFEVANKIWTEVTDNARSEEKKRVLSLLEEMGPDGFAIAIRPLLTRIFANAANLMARKIQASLVDQTLRSYQFWTTYPLKVSAVVALGYYVGHPFYIWISESLGLPENLWNGIFEGTFRGVFGLTTAVIAVSLPDLKMKWMSDRAKKVVAEKLERPEPSMNFVFGDSIYSTSHFFGSERSLPVLDLNLEEVCSAEDICKLGPAQIAGLGDIQVRSLIVRVNSYLTPNSIVPEYNRLIAELSNDRQEIAKALQEMDSDLVANNQQADASITANGILNYKLLNYKWRLEKLSAQTSEVEEGSFVDDSGLSVQTISLDMLQNRISTLLAQIAFLMEALLKAEPKSKEEIELLGFFSNKLVEHRRHLMDASETARRLDKMGEWTQWSNKIRLRAKQELKVLNDQIIPLILGNADVNALKNLPQSAALRNLKAHPKNGRVQLEVAKEYFLDTARFKQQFQIRE